jgi:hypothetical protein
MITDDCHCRTWHHLRYDHNLMGKCIKSSTLFTSYFSVPSWSWLYGSWIYNYLCNQCLSPLMLWVRILLRWGVLDTTLCDKVCLWFSPDTPVSSTNKTDCHDFTEILLKMALNTITLTLHFCIHWNHWIIWMETWLDCSLYDPLQCSFFCCWSAI